MSSGQSDQAKGRVKEAAGALTGDQELKREGKRDQSAGKLKQAIGRVRRKAEKAIDHVKGALS